MTKVSGRTGRERHHWIPQFILRNFGRPSDGKLYVFDRERPHFGVRPRAVSGCFQRPGQFTVFEGTERDDSLEQSFQRMESRTASVIGILIDAARSGRAVRMTPEERGAWAVFLYVHWCRTPDLLDKLAPEAQFRAEIAALRDDALEAVVAEVEADQLLDPALAGRLRRKMFVSVLRKLDEGAARTIASKGIITARAAPGKSFIVGSRPIFRSPGFLPDENTHFLWPIAPDVVAGFGGPPWSSTFAVINRDQVRKINLRIAEQSRQFAGASSSLINSLVRHVPIDATRDTPSR